jgi:hypothetical protein
MRKRLEI